MARSRSKVIPNIKSPTIKSDKGTQRRTPFVQPNRPVQKRLGQFNTDISIDFNKTSMSHESAKGKRPSPRHNEV